MNALKSLAALLGSILLAASAWANPPAETPPRPSAEARPAPPPQERKKTDDEVAKALPTDEAANAAINAGFARWSTAWMFDRYLPGSARANDRGLKGDTYVVRGVFDFARMGAKHTIPFAASFSRREKAGFALSNLCYNDTSSGMTACINPDSNLEAERAAAMHSPQMLGSIVLLGMVAAMSAASEGEVCIRRTTLFGETYFECE